jgi:hypothetical protein
VEPTQSNLKVSTRVAAAAYREANIAVCEDLGQPIASGDVWPLPHPLQRLAEQSALGQKAASPTSPAINSDDPPRQISPQAHHQPVAFQAQQRPLPTAPAISEFAKTALDKKIEAGAWELGRRRDIEAAVAIFIAANGDIPFNEITQDHLIAMKDLFHRLARQYVNLQPLEFQKFGKPTGRMRKLKLYHHPIRRLISATRPTRRAAPWWKRIATGMNSETSDISAGRSPVPERPLLSSKPT